MLKVMIVDDEAIFRKFLSTCIPWQQLGFDIYAEAKNGMEALEIADNNKPDIVLADINMPFMDGLALCDKLKEKFPDTSVILITGYSEFEYAKRAVKLGVADYILKPIEEDELTATLLRISCEKKKLFEEKENLQNNKELLRESFFNSLIGNDFANDTDSVKRSLEYFEIESFSGTYLVTTIEIDNMYQLWDDSDEILLWKFAVSNLLSDLISVQGNHFVFKGPEDRIISLIEFYDEKEFSEFCIDEYARLCQLVKKHFRFTLTIGIGRMHKGFSNISRSYRESVVSLQKKFLLGTDRVLRFEEVDQRNDNVGFYSSEVNESLLLSLRLNSWDKISKKLEDVFEYIKNSNLSIDYTMIICTGLVSVCLSYITESGKNIEDIFGKNFSPYSEIKEKQTIDQLYGWIVKLYKSLVEYSKENKMTKTKKLVEDAMEYIEKNFSNSELSVEKIAQNFYINSSYLRAAFKKETGTTLVDYITDLRMRKAKELIDTNCIKLSEISFMIGFSDPAYFSKCFKKYYGTTPSAYENTRK